MSRPHAADVSVITTSVKKTNAGSTSGSSSFSNQKKMKVYSSDRPTTTTTTTLPNIKNNTTSPITTRVISRSASFVRKHMSASSSSSSSSLQPEVRAAGVKETLDRHSDNKPANLTLEQDNDEEEAIAITPTASIKNFTPSVLSSISSSTEEDSDCDSGSGDEEEGTTSSSGEDGDSDNDDGVELVEIEERTSAKIDARSGRDTPSLLNLESNVITKRHPGNPTHVCNTNETNDNDDDDYGYMGSLNYCKIPHCVNWGWMCGCYSDSSEDSDFERENDTRSDDCSGDGDVGANDETGSDSDTTVIIDDDDYDDNNVEIDKKIKSRQKKALLNQRLEKKNRCRTLCAKLSGLFFMLCVFCLSGVLGALFVRLFVYITTGSVVYKIGKIEMTASFFFGDVFVGFGVACLCAISLLLTRTLFKAWLHNLLLLFYQRNTPTSTPPIYNQTVAPTKAPSEANRQRHSLSSSSRESVNNLHVVRNIIDTISESTAVIHYNDSIVVLPR